MIVEFSVKNFRSIKDLQTISFATTGLKSAEKYTTIDRDNIVRDGNTELFKTVGIYGANASGKSNIIKALDYFIAVVSSQPSAQSNLGSLCQPFLYNSDDESKESFFQMIFIINETKYRYGLTVLKNQITDSISAPANNEVIANEWLFANRVKNMTTLFQRVGNELEKNNLNNKSNIPEVIPYEHTLFLTHAAAFDNSGDCKIITDYFRTLVQSNFSVDHEKFRWISLFYIEPRVGELNKEALLKLLSIFNMKYEDIELEDRANYKQHDLFPQEKIVMIKHLRINGKTSKIKLNLKYNESAGSQKMFDLVGLLLAAFNYNRALFIILDEIDSNFHPSLLIKLIRLFNDPKMNKSNSQLLFTSHDTNLMSPSIMRRDQFYFTEKNEDESTRLYSLADLKGIKNDADFAKQYLAGYYGALPILGQYAKKQS